MITLKIFADVYTGYFEEPAYAIVKLTKKDIRKILSDIRAIKSLGIITARKPTNVPIAFYGYKGEPYQEVIKGEYKSTDVKYEPRCAYWVSAFDNNKDVSVCTKVIYVERFENYLKFMSMPTDQLALHLTDKDENIRNYIKERLKQRS